MFVTQLGTQIGGTDLEEIWYKVTYTLDEYIGYFTFQEN